MSIEFQCPNGHPLSAPDDRAGRTGKCAKCGASFRIPQRDGGQARRSDSQESYPELDDLAEAIRASTGVPAPSFAGATFGATTFAPPPAAPHPAPAPAPPPKVESPEPTIVFLCPNGHKLNGPARLQGKPGRCPHCGARFLIPNYDEEPTEGGLTLPEDSAEPPPLLESAHEDAALDFTGSLPADNGAPGSLIGAIGGDDDAPLDLGDDAHPQHAAGTHAPAGHHPLAVLFRQLWAEKARGATFELHTKDGATILPQWFAQKLPQQSHGLFASRDSDGSLLLTSVPWDSIARLVVRGVRHLPPGMFE